METELPFKATLYRKIVVCKSSGAQHSQNVSVSLCPGLSQISRHIEYVTAGRDGAETRGEAVDCLPLLS